MTFHALSHRPNRTPLFSSCPNSSSMMDPDVIEIPPPIPCSSSKSKKKQVVIHEVIDVDNNEDSSDIMIIDEIVDARNRGKAKKTRSGVCPEDFVAKTFGSRKKFRLSKHSTQGSESTSNLDYSLANGDELIYKEYFNDIDKYAMLQTHFDNVEVPAGVEASIPWFENFSDSKKKTSHGSISLTTNVNDQLHFPWLPEHAHIKKNAASVSNLSVQNPDDPLNRSSGVANLSSPFLFSQVSQSHKKSAASQNISSSQNLPFWRSLQSSQATGSTNGNNGSYSDAMLFPHAMMYHVDAPNPTVVAEPPLPLWTPVVKHKLKHSFHKKNKHNIYSSFPEGGHGAYITPQEVADIRNQRSVNEEDILSKLKLFKQFDTIEDFSDHHYASRGASTKQPPKNWSKKIQGEWKILEKDLPDTIFVRVYESRMDLLRAAIIGAEGTPYHDSLFFFDVFFPATYPEVPPLVYYHSGGLRLNPNLYACGKVCLSLLNTWSGKKKEQWIPGMSTMLQVLVSIQALVLNQKPYFNEPGHERRSGTQRGEVQSRQYNEDIFILSLKTMVYSMRRPPKHFDDLVVGHFYTRGDDILVACKAYMDGAQVGCLVKGGVQDIDEGDMSGSPKFKVSVATCVNMLVKEFTVLGVKDCEKFLTVPKSQSNGVGKHSR